MSPEDFDYAPRGPFILGIPLGDLSFSAFSSKKMFDRRWHLRAERFVVYQLAMLICLAAECTATYSYAKYEDLEEHVENAFPPADLNRTNIMGFHISTIVFCVFVATIFGADFFFLLMFPRHVFPRWYQTTKKALAVFITAGVFACALGATIVIARQSATITGVPQSTIDAATDLYFRPPLEYRSWAVNIAWICLIWPGFIACVASCILMFIADSYDVQHGTDPRYFGAYPGQDNKSSSTVGAGDDAAGVPLAVNTAKPAAPSLSSAATTPSVAAPTMATADGSKPGSAFADHGAVHRGAQAV
ncbi:uncharacterized protein JCM10292_006683 [Rhodotorula paludigena]|uniref:uncharacterized protein n=1 Tax=Rhodotorula paludigena TaxID=86838 RepID=UPI0031761094